MYIYYLTLTDICLIHCVIGDILADLALRQATIFSVDHKDAETRLVADVPVDNLFGYSSHLRKITSGTARFSMEVHGHLTMTEQKTQSIIQKYQAGG